MWWCYQSFPNADSHMDIRETVATFLEAISLSEQKGVAGNCQGSPRFHHVHDHVDNRHVHELASWNPPINAHFSALTILCCWLTDYVEIHKNFWVFPKRVVLVHSLNGLLTRWKLWFWFSMILTLSPGLPLAVLA